MARRGGAMLPPYETTDTILRLEADLRATGATTVVCLGDSFDDLEAERGLPENENSGSPDYRRGVVGFGLRATMIQALLKSRAAIWPNCPCPQLFSDTRRK